MEGTPRRGFWQRCRTWVRRARISLLVLALIAVLGLTYLNLAGLPGFLKRPLLEELNRHGVQFQYSKLRLSWYRGIVADHVRLGQADLQARPQLSAEQARLGINARALLRGRLEIESLGLRNGSLVIPVGGTNGAPRDLSLSRIHTEIEFAPDDTWVLPRFSADFLGGSLSVSGRIANASAMTDWPFLKAREPGPPGSLEARLGAFAEALDRIEFLDRPELKLDFEGDARDLDSFAARLVVLAPATETSWGTLRDGTLTARLFASDHNGSSRSSLVVQAREALTPWADTTNFHLSATFTAAPGRTNLESVAVQLSAAQASTRWARASRLSLDLQLSAVPGPLQLVDGTLTLVADMASTPWADANGVTARADWRQTLTNPVPLSGEVRIDLNDARSGWGSATNVALTARLADGTATRPEAPAGWGWWTNLAPYRLAWDARLERVAVRDVQAGQVASSGTWTAPLLTMTNLQAVIDGRTFRARGDLEVNTRRTELQVDSEIDPHRVESLLTPEARRWLGQFTWNRPPTVSGRLEVVLPPWTGPQPDWRETVRPTLELEAQFALEGGATYRKIPVSSARSKILYTNETWCLPELRATRPEGELRAFHTANERTRAFRWVISSTFDPLIVRPLLGTNEQSGLELVVLTEPPQVTAQIDGVSRQPETLRFRGNLALTNFTFRGQSFSGVQTAFDYENKVLRFSDPRSQRGSEILRADLVIADFNRQLVYITNGFSTADPLPVARAIGYKVGKAIEPYQFSLPPVVRVWGAVPMRGEEGADLRFTVDGGPFHWHRFNVPRIHGDVHWAGLGLSLNNVNVDFYGGKAEGSARFYFDRGPGADYEFTLAATNSILQDLMADYFSRTNSLEGRLSGKIIITGASTEDWRRTQGSGTLELSDGLIWDIPLFGVLSPALDAILPGLGSSRASSATCSFTIRQGVVQSDDLEARSPAMRLRYRGSVDLEGRIDARVEAELLRDMWVLGPLVSTVFWPVTKMFEYRATGSLGDPKLDPVYIFPRLIRLPFQPLRFFRGLFPGESGSGKPATPNGE